MESVDTSWREDLADAEPSGVEAALRRGASAVPGLKEIACSGAPGAAPWLALSTLGEMPGDEAEQALFDIAAVGDEGPARLALVELGPRLESDRVGRILALLERRLEPPVRVVLYELAVRLDAPLEHVRASWEEHAPETDEEARAALLALHLLGDDAALAPLLEALDAMRPADAGEPLELVRVRPPEAPAARLLAHLLADARLVDGPPPEDLGLDLGPGLRVCDLAASCAVELFGDADAIPEMRRYDDAEREVLLVDLQSTWTDAGRDP
ncbi:MAG: hypothetical protein KC619_19535 [Myxococcales bacterium]|nr:hypothetical protein [Myxococcales bacterium]